MSMHKHSESKEQSQHYLQKIAMCIRKSDLSTGQTGRRVRYPSVLSRFLVFGMPSSAVPQGKVWRVQRI
jgi:hypothetical protein